ncbi:ATP-binding protein [Burkholderia pseudomultivorans]|uniref:ATP-binding protein n=1 Tax=Burkholderia pseudomultivorans TaxID=1207504 RepID=UPI00075A8ED7|nr:ATP-binding protein [Burkholderia pseudomultivorans]KVC26430.1 histidine kinase [Burkholderia pseudomultivorans]KVC36288.1 histidine kinase [Burkholderia pseudomultivorans]MDR8735349.1 Sensor histidine kinase RegB [Burkholderia pseudomultivorans]MDR8741275.1 Sensor histidine kinase RegB [Burkholderia pseudomultivorans]MDR8777689.1 Sensor histidine kinase RegB [Burkholderia pseudomultivorans]
MQRITTTGRVNLSHLFWLRNLAIIGQLVTIGVVQTYFGVHLPLPAMLMVIALEIVFNGLTWVRVLRARPETNFELLGQLWVDLGALSALLFLSGGTTNPFVSLYLPSLAIAAAVLPWHLMIWLAAFAVACYAALGFDSVPLNMDNPANLFDYYRTGMWVNFMVSVGLIAWFVARMSNALRQRDSALGEAQQRLLRDERAVALGVQAATVAHEMGTPLSTIAMLAEELRDAARDDPGLARYEADLKVLEEQMTLCTSALARLRSRASAPASRQPVDDWLDTFVEHWRLRHPHVRFELLGARPAGVALDDTVAAGQILTILLDNAARASAHRVTLAAKVAHGDAADTIEFEVCDDGPGIPAALRESLGAMPVDSTQGGHGVGLYLAFSAAARLGGEIELSDVTPRAGANGRAGGAPHGQAAAAAERTPGTPDGRPPASGRGTRAVLRLPVARMAAQAVSTNT